MKTHEINFKLRPWKFADLDDLVMFANNEKIAVNLTDTFPHPYTQEDGRQFLSRVITDSPEKVLAIDINGKASGSVGIFPQHDIFRRNAEMGYWLAEPFWGRGIMTKAVKEMIVYGFRNFDIDRIFARPFGTNTASQKVLEHAGFELEARFKGTIIKNGLVLDELVYGIRRIGS